MSVESIPTAKDLLADIKKRIIYTEYTCNEVYSLAALILREIFNVDYTQLLLNKKIDIFSEQLNIVENVINKINIGIPIQYVFGFTHFYGQKFKINSSALIPRPETEELVSIIIKSIDNSTKLNIMDIGTGSGCIAITLKKYFFNSIVSATDICLESLLLAQENAINLNVKVNFFCEDVCDFKRCGLLYDVIVSNPPYVLISEMCQMQNIITQHEPPLALFVSDEDPLKFYKAIVGYCRQRLNKNGLIFFEINEKFGFETKQLLDDNDFYDVHVFPDINGKDRIVWGRML